MTTLLSRLPVSAAIFFSFAGLALAQTTFTDNFSSSANWTAGGSFGGGSLAISGGNAGYSTSNSEYNWSILTLGSTTLSYTSNWEVQVDVNAAAAGTLTTGSHYFYGSLTAFRTGDAINGNDDPPVYNSFSADIVRGGSTSNYFQTTSSLAGSGSFESAAVNNSSTSAALRLTFDASTKVLTGFFDANGSTGGYSWTSLGSVDIDGAQNWGMTGGNTFSIALAVYAGTDTVGGTGPVITAANANFDNFSATAIPEPSTYGIIAAASALGLAFWRRRRAGTKG